MDDASTTLSSSNMVYKTALMRETSIQTTVAIIALFITTLATAIALWECIIRHRGSASPQRQDHGDTSGEYFSRKHRLSCLEYMGWDSPNQKMMQDLMVKSSRRSMRHPHRAHPQVRCVVSCSATFS